MPGDLHITHISFYAVHPKLVHKFHKNLNLYTFPIDEDLGVPTEEVAGEFKPTSSTIKDKVARAIATLGFDPVGLRRPPPKVR